MSLSFPSSPTLNQTSVQNGRTYQWNGYAWDLASNIANHASTHASTGSDPIYIIPSQISGVIPDSSLSTNIQNSINIYLWSNFR